jgi:MFS superfamily sulfate permease-like transporter
MALEVSVIGKIPSGLPNLVMPSLDFQRLPLLMAAAIQLAFLGAIDFFPSRQGPSGPR